MGFQIKRKPALEPAQINALRTAINWQPSAFDYTLALERSFLYYGVLENHNLIGFLNVISDGVSYALIVDMMVHPTYQHQGIGKQLLQTAIQDLQTTNVARVCVMFDESLRDFYTSLGFTNLEGGLLRLEVKNN
jgi:N-acetylglutamate synthase-like GNAT family acetyltransferase